ncbi:RtcB family protein [Paenalcaligenes niemegkensis]|uniref:RtcB family protein n=1 Tax=Paenalcaligenes niemegkensis TaxID=2895469 RepID=UPI001EE854AE|nr:RtcB family protein [Paenalcaligenes niemegkensis]MCQ9617425.1 RtcB family protein [Paenalcaligenes niemegkensis]
MKQVIHEPLSRPIKIWTDDIDDAALQQLRNIASMPFIDEHGVVAMPDVHVGIGATVGSVIATDHAIIPAAVGVDIGCGINAVRLSLTANDLPDNLVALRHQIERDIPLGPGGSHKHKNMPDFNAELVKGLKNITDKHPKLERNNAQRQIGTLGSGNHFIEVCLDETDAVWVMLHSGSRGIGNLIGRYFIEKAKRHMEHYHISLPDNDLAYLPDDTDDFTDYVNAVQWAQDYAFENRRVMMARTIAALRRHIKVPFQITQEAINCHHNYVEKENHFGRNLWITRKGAIRARKGDLGVIPGSMGQRSFVVRGKGNLDSYCSCAHGAGRKYSRTAARNHFSVADLIEQTEGVECRKDNAVLDELPSAYKDIDQVMEHQKDLVEVLHVLKQVVCVKGA